MRPRILFDEVLQYLLKSFEDQEPEEVFSARSRIRPRF